MSGRSSVENTKLLKRVELLLEGCGFEISRRDSAIDGPVIKARAFGRCVYAWCYEAARYDQTRGRLSTDISRCSTVAHRQPKTVSILVYAGYHIPKSYLQLDDAAGLLRKRVVIWDDERLEYYTRMEKAIGTWSVYQILTDLGFDVRLGPSLELPATRVRQGRSGYSFKITPIDLLKLAFVFRRPYGKAAYQRILNPGRLKKEIAPYIEETNAVIPTSIVCIFMDKVAFSKKRSILRVPLRAGSVWIIDGQHRLYAFCHVSEAKRCSFELSCVGYSADDIPLDEQARLFIDINQTARKVPSYLLYDLYETIHRKDLRVETVKNLAKTRLFRDKISFTEEKNPISLVSFATNQAMTRLISGDGLKNWHSKSRSKTTYDEFVLYAFKAFFAAVSRKFRKEWDNPQRYVLASNRGIRALLRLMIESLKYAGGVKPRVFGEVAKALRGVELRLSQMGGKYAGEAGAAKLYQNWEEHIRRQIPAFGRTKGQILDSVKIGDGEVAKAVNKAKHWLGQLKGEVVGELSYVDKSTITYLQSLGRPSRVRLKVGQIWGTSDFEAEAKSLVSSGVDLEVCLVQFETSEGVTSAIHERWLADEKREIDFGTDLRDSSLGNKEHTIQVFDKSAASERWSSFDATWMRTESAKGGKRKVVEAVFP